MPLDPLRADDPTHLGHWTLDGRLGAGGMGVVYLAHGPGHDRAALKLVRRELADDATFRARFRREVDAVRRVEGDRIARLIEADPEADQPYLVTEFVDGPTLAQAVVETGPLHGERLVAFAAALAEAVISIHQAGLVHRDLKPANVLLTADAPKVVDFGVATASEATAITQAGVVLGSPGWMAPEQVQGAAASPAIDVFTWAAVVTYAATGSPPFGEGRPEAIAYRIVHEAPDLTGIEPPLRPLLEEAFARDPSARPSMADLLGRLVHERSRDPGVLAAETTRLLASTWVMPPVAWVPVPPTPSHPAGAGPPVAPAPSHRPSPHPAAAARRTRRWPARVAGLVAFLLVAGAGTALVLWIAGGRDDGGEAAETTLPPETTTTTLPPIGDVTVALTVRDELERELGAACESAPPYDDVSYALLDAADGERLADSATVDAGEAVEAERSFVDELLGGITGGGDPTDCRYEALIPDVPPADGYVLISSITGDESDEIELTQDDLEEAGFLLELEVSPPQ